MNGKEKKLGMKKHGYFQLSRENVRDLVEEYGSPLLVLSTQQVESNYKRLRRYLPRVRVHYAIKANPHPEILRTMIKLGSSFDVASDGEIRLLNSMGVKGERMIYANPMKTQGGLKACRECRATAWATSALFLWSCLHEGLKCVIASLTTVRFSQMKSLPSTLRV